MKRVPYRERIGQKFGRLTIICLAGKDQYDHQRFVCRCDCGIIRKFQASHVISGESKSCGCLVAELAAAKGRKNRKHGMCGTRVYAAWCSARKRCESSSCKDWPRYGGRGIKFCERWQTFENFLADLGEPEDGQSLDRIDPSGNYEPGNVRWTDAKTQTNNRCNTIYLTFDGKTQALAIWAAETGISQDSLRTRIRLQWPIEKILTEPVRPRRTGCNAAKAA